MGAAPKCSKVPLKNELRAAPEYSQGAYFPLTFFLFQMFSHLWERTVAPSYQAWKVELMNNAFKYLIPRQTCVFLQMSSLFISMYLGHIRNKCLWWSFFGKCEKVFEAILKLSVSRHSRICPHTLVKRTKNDDMFYYFKPHLFDGSFVVWNYYFPRIL